MGTKHSTPAIDRFWKSVPERPDDGCWFWKGARWSSGYGAFVLPIGPRSRERAGSTKRREVAAHRWLWEHLNGPVPEGLELDHTCHGRDITCAGGKRCLHRRCVRPSHLDPVSRRVNVARGLGVAAVHMRKTRCVNGHPFDKDNTYWRKGGGRACRECGRITTRTYKARVRRSVQHG